jgi:hypothetical protein
MHDVTALTEEAAARRPLDPGRRRSTHAEPEASLGMEI